MTFKPALWRPIAIGLSAINLAAAGYAIALAQPEHAGIHGVLAMAFGFWANHMRASPVVGEFQDRLETLEIEATRLRQELTDMQERMDFAERLLAQEAGTRRINPER